MTAGGAASVSGNVTVETCAAAQLSDCLEMLRPTNASPKALRACGLDAGGNHCGATGTDTCGPVEDDLETALRTCPDFDASCGLASDCYSIGAIEIEP